MFNCSAHFIKQQRRMYFEVQMIKYELQLSSRMYEHCNMALYL